MFCSSLRGFVIEEGYSIAKMNSMENSEAVLNSAVSMDKEKTEEKDEIPEVMEVVPSPSAEDQDHVDVSASCAETIVVLDHSCTSQLVVCLPKKRIAC